MKKIPQYMQIGLEIYKTQRISREDYTVWQCKDIGSLKYLGEWTSRQLMRCYQRGELI